MRALLVFTLMTSTAFACEIGESIVTPSGLSYVCDQTLENGWRDPRGVVWGQVSGSDCESIGARVPTAKELEIHNEELGVSESGDRCVKSVIHHYFKFPRTPALPYTASELDFYREEDLYGEFSNFGGFPVFMDGEWFATSEHYYQTQKYETEELRDWVHYAPTPMEAANRGRDSRFPKRDDWDDVKDGIMEKVLFEKYTRHPELKELLLSTGDSHLYEHTTNDCYWADCGDRSGKNHLGELLMKVRDSLR
jgi:ribA/ribD-fused uncharacterized protein